ncbi:tyrosine-type recombinase/integrase [Streptomyces californicus]|uniref:tyrosine-type recombinase/integrase n=1 Tax=Streptomyces californicus TaxID=67351 RepID=UPI00296F6327|nr:tyrosine-type recombinase/integrase [Streptomyces californicus]MDW4901341.1 tyrosine-type recombinase/integrase [Streptomyces californicus]
MSRVVDLPGAAHLVLADGVVHLDPEPAVFDAMLDGWARQQRTRFLDWESTIRPRVSLVKRLARFTNQYPWQWELAELEAFFDYLRTRRPGKPLAVSTARNYQNDLRLFLEYVTDTRYGWPATCSERFDRVPVQLLHEWNTVTHTSEYEGAAERRPLTYDEVQALFDAADGRVENIRTRRRKGSLAALRDAMVLKAVYAYGLRRQEACGLDISDLRRNPKVASYRNFGAIFVRYGKASKGGPPKRRSVLTVPEMDWIVEVLDQYLTEVRPGFNPGKHPAFWVTERRGRMSLRRLNAAFESARQAADLPAELDLHSLRHSYVTHLIEFGYPERFVQDQVGHAYASTTAIYSHVSDEYRNRLLLRSLQARHGDLWGLEA